jgi:hypothetical protein
MPMAPKRHQADFHVAAAQDFAQQRAGADADGKHHQQQGRHLLVAMQHFLGKAGELAQEDGTEEPHPADAQQERNTTRLPRASLRLRSVSVIGFQLIFNPGSVAGAGGNELRDQAADHGCQQHAGHGDTLVPDFGNRHNQAAGQVAQQDRDEGAHFDHAVAAGQFALVEHLGQQGKFDWSEQGGVQAHQKDAGQQDDHVVVQEAVGRHQHDHDLQVLDEADHAGLVVLVGQLAAGALRTAGRAG